MTFSEHPATGRGPHRVKRTRVRVVVPKGPAVRNVVAFVVVALLPLAALGAGVVAAFQEPDVTLGTAARFWIGLGGLFTATLGFAGYVYSRYRHIYQLPCLWVALMMLEFIISPAYDLVFGVYPLRDQRFLDGMAQATVICTLFTMGLWLGVFFAGLGKGDSTKVVGRERPLAALRGRRRFAVTAGISVLALASVPAQIYVVFKSGVMNPDVADPRGASLMGTTMLKPLLQIGDVAIVVSAWLSAYAPSRRERRRFAVLGIFAVVCACVLPIMLRSRAPILRALILYSLPMVLAGRWLPGRQGLYAVVAVPLVLATAWVFNGMTASFRGMSLSGGSVDYAALVEEEAITRKGATHFRHVWLLSDLLNKGVQARQERSNWWNKGFAGDMLIVLPRIVFPAKPVTSMEVVNTVVMGRPFTAENRGEASVSTVSLWTQLYLLGGTVGVMPLAATYAFCATRFWSWAARHSRKLPLMVLAATSWFVLGWVSVNSIFSTLFAPGIALGVLLAAIMFPEVAKTRGRDRVVEGVKGERGVPRLVPTGPVERTTRKRACR